MNYEALYTRLMESRRANPPTGYSERHHIIPRCEGGSDDPENLVRLSARDHLFAHLILAKWKGGKHWAALTFMLGRVQPSSQTIHLAARYREQAAQYFRTLRHLPETRVRISRGMQGKQNSLGHQQTNEHRQKTGDFHRGRKRSEETRKRLSDAHKGNTSRLGRPHSEETKAKMRAAWVKRRDAL